MTSSKCKTDLISIFWRFLKQLTTIRLRKYCRFSVFFFCFFFLMISSWNQILIDWKQHQSCVRLICALRPCRWKAPQSGFNFGARVYIVCLWTWTLHRRQWIFLIGFILSCLRWLQAHSYCKLYLSSGAHVCIYCMSGPPRLNTLKNLQWL